MTISCMSVKDKLYEHGLISPELEVLKPNNQNYSCALLQPSGPIYADDTRIGHFCRPESEVRCKSFLETASSKNIELAIAPEYCIPWNTLQEIANGTIFPAPGQLWVLGCESATTHELESFKGATATKCKTIHEALPNQGNYTDPLAYCFQTQDLQGEWHRVILLQFKTTASRDDLFLENENLKCGSVIYQFQNQDSLLNLASIICSDSFGIANTPILNKLSDRSILIHIQLNPNPRHMDYRAYRGQIFGLDNDCSNCDIICLNWAQNIEQHSVDGSVSAKWKNIAGSAWYLPETRCITKDHNILRNHEKGLYYCYMKERRHALFFHYDEAAFELCVSKPIANGFGVVVNKQGPLMNARWLWDDASIAWKDSNEIADSGLINSIEADPDLYKVFSNFVTSADALAVERALVLVCGTAKHIDDWYKVDELDSCLIKNDEILKRITFAGDNNEEASQFRHDRLQKASILGNLLVNNINWPPQVKDIQGARIEWSATNPNYNSYKHGVNPAVMVYLGENPRPDTVDKVRDKLLDTLRRDGKPYWKRLAVCFRMHGNLNFADNPSLTHFDKTSESMTDFTAV